MAAKHKHSVKACRSFMSEHIKTHMNEGMKQPQAVAVAYSEARKAGCVLPKKKKR
ncbi:MAG TPA: hypothetical protein VGQ00_00665 [Candidatus Norongarragalinales archaeon]|nr:hypothetical protein [Candidatus Norongarragalinales archaeon]